MARRRFPRADNDIVQLKVRLTEALRRRLEHEAASNKHSMNSEIVARLQRSFMQHDDQVAVVAETLYLQLDSAIIERIIQLDGENRSAMDYDEHDD
jgi:hypothetical protein